MKLKVNGEERELAEDRLSVEALLERLDIAQRKGVAIAVNDAVVPKSQWAQRQLEGGDAVEIIRATQGG